MEQHLGGVRGAVVQQSVVRRWTHLVITVAVCCGTASGVSAQTARPSSDQNTLLLPSPPAACAVTVISADRVSPGKVVVASTGEIEAVPGARGRQWTVQVASFESIDDAHAMQQLLCQHGFEARVVGRVRPYIVRVGWYPSSSEALIMARHLAAPKRTVFVTQSDR